MTLWIHLGIPNMASGSVRQFILDCYASDPGRVLYPSVVVEPLPPGVTHLLMHGPFWPAHRSTNATCRWVTTLRDPFAAVVSEYFWRVTRRYYGVKGLWHDVSEQDKAFSLSLEQFAAALPPRLNPACRLICATEESVIPGVDVLRPECWGRYQDYDDDEWFERALEILRRRFAFYAPTEMLDEALLVLACMMGISQPPVWNRRNPTIRPPGWTDARVSDEARRAIEAATQADRRLYRHAVAHFTGTLLPTAGLDPEVADAYRRRCRMIDAHALRRCGRDGKTVWQQESATLTVAKPC